MVLRKKAKPKKSKHKNLSKLKTYVKKNLDRGYSKKCIIDACIKVGWKREDLEEVLKKQ